MKVNITFYFEKNKLYFENLTFDNATNFSGIRYWLNTHDKFVDVGNTIINLNNVIYIKIEECKK